MLAAKPNAAELARHMCVEGLEKYSTQAKLNALGRRRHESRIAGDGCTGLSSVVTVLLLAKIVRYERFGRGDMHWAFLTRALDKSRFSTLEIGEEQSTRHGRNHMMLVML